MTTSRSPPTNHYDVLGVSPTATVTDIKAAYHQCILILHPDKSITTTTTTTISETATESAEQDPSTDVFVSVQRAWEVLRNPDTRASYDRQLAVAAAQASVHISDRIDIMHMTECIEDGSMTGVVYPCRCGGQFFVEEKELLGLGVVNREGGDEPSSIIVPCSTCSLHIEVYAST